MEECKPLLDGPVLPPLHAHPQDHPPLRVKHIWSRRSEEKEEGGGERGKRSGEKRGERREER